MRGARGLFGDLVVLVLVFGLLLGAEAAAQEAPQEEIPALISADEITYDEALGIVTARGDVEISQEDRVVIADTVSYNLNTEVVTASGNVTLMEPTGEIVFAEYVELTGDLKEGFIRDVRVLMTDRTKLAARGGVRSGGNRTEFRRGVFSPCELCKEDPTRAPLWQLKAAEVVHDQQEQIVQYRDVWLEFFGVPVFYTPYFQHPDPTVERQSGLLAPTIRSSESLGFVFEQPYYWAIDEDKDATFTPFMSTSQGPGLMAEYRQLFPFGKMEFEGSGTIADLEERDGTIENDKLRGHIDAWGRFDIDESWRAGFDLQRATDQTYLRLYDFSSERTLTSNAFVENFNGRSYGAANTYLFQGMRASDDNDEQPIVVPQVAYDFVSEPDAWGGVVNIDTNLLNIYRLEGQDTRRLATQANYELPFQGPIGDLYDITAQITAAGYWANDSLQGDDGDFSGQVYPQIAGRWRYPWIQHNETFDQVIEPTVQVVLAPELENQNELPNEDSLTFEFDDTNLFSLNRFPGLDRIDAGSRVDYGLEWSAYWDGGGKAGAFLGQSFRFSEVDDVFVEGPGLEEGFSDIVGRVDLSPIPEVNFLYRFRLDNSDLTFERNELDLAVGPPIFRFGVNYLSITDEEGDERFGDREEVTLRASSRLTDHWSVYSAFRRDIGERRNLKTQFGAIYHDECFLIQGVVARENFRDREIEPETTFFLRLVLKHLGETGLGS